MERKHCTFFRVYNLKIGYEIKVKIEQHNLYSYHDWFTCYLHSISCLFSFMWYHKYFFLSWNLGATPPFLPFCLRWIVFAPSSTPLWLSEWLPYEAGAECGPDARQFPQGLLANTLGHPALSHSSPQGSLCCQAGTSCFLPIPLKNHCVPV